MALIDIPTLEEFKQALRQVLNENLSKNTIAQKSEHLLTKAEVADLLKVSQSTVDNLRRRGELLSVNLPLGGVRFKYSEVLQFINEKRD